MSALNPFLQNPSENDPNRKRKNIPSPKASPSKKEKKSDISSLIKEPTGLTCESSALECIYLKIIHSKSEFNSFTSQTNFENVFHPLYAVQFCNNEIISGYKNLKILISLTPKYFYPHIKIVYEKELKFHDDLYKIISDFFTEGKYTLNDKEFISELEKENQEKIKGDLIFKENNRYIYVIDIINMNFLKENYQLQTLIRFFIDGASYIDIENNFWNYYLYIEKKSESDLDWITVGYCSFKNFHMEINKYVSMISQFIILPCYQRYGHGSFLLEKIYKYQFETNKNNCREITTEDPCVEFLLMRDYVIIKLILENGFIDEFLSKLKLQIDNDELYELFDYYKNNEMLKKIIVKLKLQKYLIKRALEIIKIALCNNKFLDMFYKEKKDELRQQLLKDEYEFYQNALNKKYGPFIYFHNDSEFDVKAAIEEEKKNMTVELPIEQKVEILFIEFEKDLKNLIPKVGKMVMEYKSRSKGKK